MGVLVICIIVTEDFLTLTEVFPCFILSCKANAKVKLAKTGQGLHSSTLLCICVVRLLFVLFYVLFVCKCVLPPVGNSSAVNKYIIPYVYNSNNINIIRTIYIYILFQYIYTYICCSWVKCGEV